MEFESMSYRIRDFLPTDHHFIINVTSRMSEFELKERRQAQQIDNTNIAMLIDAMEEVEADPDTAIFVVEDETRMMPVGFIRLQTQLDYFSKEKHGYIANIAVDIEHEGKGIGRMLMAQAEVWAQDKGYSLLTLNVFEENTRAQEIYKKIGYSKDIIMYSKVLKPKT